jgi:hypothetical protein
MRICEVNLYKYDELSDEAKEKAREWWRTDTTTNNDHSIFDSVLDDAKEIAAKMGIAIDKIYFSGFWSQGDGACFTGSYSYQKGALESIKKEYPKDGELHAIAKQLQDLQSKYFYKLCADVEHRGRYSHSFCTEIDVYHNDDRYRPIADAEQELKDILRDYMDWIYQKLENEYDYQMSDEVVAENIVSNEYEFNEDGEIH